MKLLKINVLGTDWQVEFVDSRSNDLYDKNHDSVCEGYTCYIKYKISISNDLSPAAALTTLCHEIFHAACIVILSTPDSRRDEETYADIAGHYTYSAMKQLDKWPPWAKKRLGI